MQTVKIMRIILSMYCYTRYKGLFAHTILENIWRLRARLILLVCHILLYVLSLPLQLPLVFPTHVRSTAAIPCMQLQLVVQAKKTQIKVQKRCIHNGQTYLQNNINLYIHADREKRRADETVSSQSARGRRKLIAVTD